MCRIIVAAFVLTLLLNTSVATADTTSTAIPKSRNTALTRSLLWTLVPAAVGGALMLHGQRISPLGSKQDANQTDDTETLAGLAIGSVGIVLGPGAGHAYAGKMGRFWGGIAIRISGVALTAVIALPGSGNSSWSSMEAQIAQVVVAFVMGGSICLGSAIYDIATVGNSVNDYNEERGFRTLTLKPAYIAAYKAPGLVLNLTF